MRRFWAAAQDLITRHSALVFAAISVAIIATWIGQWVDTFQAWASEGQRLGTDLRLYLSATERWLSGGSFYPQRQLDGPYDVLGVGEILYPPVTLLLFLPFTLLPAAVWWLIPLSVVAGVIWYWRPAPFGWPLLALILWWPRTNQDLLTGNPAIWVTAAAALGTVWSWASVLVFIKPTLAPAALVGIRRRSWWIGLAGLIAASLLFIPMWSDYAMTLAYARHPHGWLYSVSEFPMVLVGVAAWAASGRRRAESPSTTARIGGIRNGRSSATGSRPR
jgi:hypothetical protein